MNNERKIEAIIVRKNIEAFEIEKKNTCYWVYWLHSGIFFLGRLKKKFQIECKTNEKHEIVAITSSAAVYSEDYSLTHKLCIIEILIFNYGIMKWVMFHVQ